MTVTFYECKEKQIIDKELIKWVDAKFIPRVDEHILLTDFRVFRVISVLWISSDKVVITLEKVEL